MSIRDEIARYRPDNEQEARDQAVILAFLDRNEDALTVAGAVLREGIIH